jgi:4-hydroxy-tetrahydrodipicolinate synthase
MDIKGIIPAMVTPFNKDETLNEGALRQLVSYLIEGGVHGLFAVGSQGEFYALTPNEKQRVWEIVADETAGRVPVYAGTAGITTRETMMLNNLAERAGADAVSILTPFFINPTQEELYKHYTTIADATRLPVLLYNNPGRAGGLNLSVDLVARLAQHPNIAGIKDSSGDFSLTAEYLRCVDESFAVLLGRDTLIYAGLTHGAKGSITATANVAPKLVVEIYQAFMDGDWERSLAAQQRLAPLRHAFGLGTFPVVVKEALTLIGINAGPARAPVGPMPAENREKLARVLREMGLLAKPAQIEETEHLDSEVAGYSV